MSKSIMDAVRRWLLTCPALDRARIDIDCLGSAPGQYSVDGEPTEAVVQRYLDGSTVRRLSFAVASREFYGQDIAGQDDNLAAFEALTDWMELQMARRSGPDLGPGKRVRSLRVVSTAYPVIVDPETGTARYQISCELIYTKEALKV